MPGESRVCEDVVSLSSGDLGISPPSLWQSLIISIWQCVCVVEPGDPKIVWKQDVLAVFRYAPLGGELHLFS